MKKQKNSRHEVPVVAAFFENFEWYSIPELKDIIAKMEALGVVRFRFEAREDYGGVDFDQIARRLETDKELEIRLKKEEEHRLKTSEKGFDNLTCKQRKLKEIEDQELKLLLQLQKKYKGRTLNDS